MKHRVRCEDCGLLAWREGDLVCVHPRGIPGTDPAEERAWERYFETIYEDGEKLSPAQHLLLDAEQRRSRRMRGPI